MNLESVKGRAVAERAFVGDAPLDDDRNDVDLLVLVGVGLALWIEARVREVDELADAVPGARRGLVAPEAAVGDEPMLAEPREAAER